MGDDHIHGDQLNISISQQPFNWQQTLFCSTHSSTLTVTVWIFYLIKLLHLWNTEVLLTICQQELLYSQWVCSVTPVTLVFDTGLSYVPVPLSLLSLWIIFHSYAFFSIFLNILILCLFISPSKKKTQINICLLCACSGQINTAWGKNYKTGATENILSIMSARPPSKYTILEWFSIQLPLSHSSQIILEVFCKFILCLTHLSSSGSFSYNQGSQATLLG